MKREQVVRRLFVSAAGSSRSRLASFGQARIALMPSGQPWVSCCSGVVLAGGVV